ncbi:MAG: hypothetical protein QOD42_2709 [Sphingomonadales bacterium]|nr:hypothetical protein [Sphingomonadales bacterium]
MHAMPVWLQMLLGAVLGFVGFGLAVRAKPGPSQKLYFIGGAVMVLIGAFLLLSNFL